MYDDVAARDALRESRVPYVQNPPVHAVDIAAAFVHPDDAAHLRQTGELLGQGASQSRRRAGDRDGESLTTADRSRGTARGIPTSPCANSGGFVVQLEPLRARLDI
jgi:hypothetical protein